MNNQKKIYRVAFLFIMVVTLALLGLMLRNFFIKEVNIAFASDPRSALFQEGTFQMDPSFAYSGYGQSAILYLLKNFFSDPILISFLFFYAFMIGFSLFFLHDMGQENLNLLNKLKMQKKDLSYVKNECRSFRIQNRQERIEYENVLHQIKSSLAALLLRAELIEPGKNKDQMLAEIDRCSLLIDTYLTKSVAYSMKSYRFSLGNFADLFRSVNDRLSEKVAKRNIKLHMDLDSSWMFMDPVKMEEALETILSNFIEYSVLNSTVFVGIEHTVAHIILRISGMPNNEPFSSKPVRYHSKRANHYGIGTDLAYEVIESHFGTIDSHIEDKKYILTIRFPVQKSEQNFSL